MDQEGREAPTAARWLAWVTAVLLAVAGVSASVVEARNGRSSGVVSASGRTSGTVEVPTPSSSSSTTTIARAPTSTPPTTVARTTTVPKAAAAVLAAIASTAPPTTQAPATTTTTRPPTTTTAPSTSTTSTSTTSTTIPAPALLTIVNDHPNAFVVTVNGKATEVAAGQQAGPVEVTPAPKGSDAVQVRAVADATCVAGGVGAFFQAGGRYKLTITAGQAACANFPVPEFTITAA